MHVAYTWSTSGGHTALSALNKLFVQVWEEEAVPDEWYQGIIIPLYKDKGLRPECSNYSGITLLSAPGKVFAHLLLAHIKPTLLSHRCMQQSGLTPGRSTYDCILTLCNIVQRHQTYGRSTYLAYVAHFIFNCVMASECPSATSTINFINLLELCSPENKLCSFLFKNKLTSQSV